VITGGAAVFRPGWCGSKRSDRCSGSFPVFRRYFQSATTGERLDVDAGAGGFEPGREQMEERHRPGWG